MNTSLSNWKDLLRATLDSIEKIAEVGGHDSSSKDQWLNDEEIRSVRQILDNIATLQSDTLFEDFVFEKSGELAEEMWIGGEIILSESTACINECLFYTMQHWAGTVIHNLDGSIKEILEDWMNLLETSVSTPV